MAGRRGPTLRDNSLTKLVDERIRRKKTRLRGLIQKNRDIGTQIIHRIGDGGASIEALAEMFPVIDVAINADKDGAATGGAADPGADQNEFPVILNVPVSTSARGLGRFRYLNHPVEMQISETGRVEVVGLSKRGPGFVHKVKVSVSSGAVIPGSEQTLGSFQATLEYGDIATAGGYGTVPYGAVAVYDAIGTFIRLVS